MYEDDSLCRFLSAVPLFSVQLMLKVLLPMCLVDIGAVTVFHTSTIALHLDVQALHTSAIALHLDIQALPRGIDSTRKVLPGINPLRNTTDWNMRHGSARHQACGSNGRERAGA